MYENTSPSENSGDKIMEILHVYEEFVSKTSCIHSDMLHICITDFLLQLK